MPCCTWHSLTCTTIWQQWPALALVANSCLTRVHSFRLPWCRLGFMPIITQCITVFVCSNAIDGVRYLAEDMVSKLPRHQTAPAPAYSNKCPSTSLWLCVNLVMQRVECRGPTYTVLASTAAIVLVGFGLGFPVTLLFVLGKATRAKLAEPAFEATWGFFYRGELLFRWLGDAEQQQLVCARFSRHAAQH